MADRLAAMLRREPTDDANFARILALHMAETKMVMSLATKLRLTPQSNRKARDGREERRPQPWERD
jgi:hypothetical protein